MRLEVAESVNYWAVIVKCCRDYNVKVEGAVVASFMIRFIFFVGKNI